MTNAAWHSRRARDAQTALRSKFRRRIYTRAGIALNIAKLPELIPKGLTGVTTAPGTARQSCP
jgi:hypothetical protein